MAEFQIFGDGLAHRPSPSRLPVVNAAMVIECVAEGSSVAGTVWHGAAHPETFMVEGALIRRADVGFDV